MKPSQASATAYLVAENIALLARHDAARWPLVAPEAAKISAWLIETRRLPASWAYHSKRLRVARSLFNWLERLTIPGLQLHHALRKLALEETARAALAEGFTQVLVWGAGFDTLALRLHREFPAVRFIEADHPATQAVKRRVIAQRGLARDNFHLLPLDLTSPGATTSVSQSTIYQPQARTLFIAEGLLMYLTPDEIDALFGFVRRQRNARFAFTFMETNAAGRVNFRNSTRAVDWWLRLRGEPFKWGLRRDELANFVTAKGFSLRAQLTAADLRQKYLTAPDLRQALLAEGENICVADCLGED